MPYRVLCPSLSPPAVQYSGAETNGDIKVRHLRHILNAAKDVVQGCRVKAGRRKGACRHRAGRDAVGAIWFLLVPTLAGVGPGRSGLLTPADGAVRGDWRALTDAIQEGVWRHRVAPVAAILRTCGTGRGGGRERVPSPTCHHRALSLSNGSAWYGMRGVLTRMELPTCGCARTCCSARLLKFLLAPTFYWCM